MRRNREALAGRCRASLVGEKPPLRAKMTGLRPGFLVKLPVLSIPGAYHLPRTLRVDLADIKRAEQDFPSLVGAMLPTQTVSLPVG